MRWLVPSAVASARRLRSAPPWWAMWSIAASRSFARGLASIMYQMVHVPNGTENLGPRGGGRGRRHGVRLAAGRRELAPLVAPGVVRAGPRGRARRPRRRPPVPDRRHPLVREDRRARARPPVRLRAGPRPAAAGLRRLRRPFPGRRWYGD